MDQISKEMAFIQMVKDAGYSIYINFYGYDWTAQLSKNADNVTVTTTSSKTELQDALEDAWTKVRPVVAHGLPALTAPIDGECKVVGDDD